MDQQLESYGIWGIIIAGLVTWILMMRADQKALLKETKDALNKIAEKHENTIEKIVEKHEDMINSIVDKTDNRQEETNKVIREHTNMLSRLTSILER